jgi:hypothetical protein
MKPQCYSVFVQSQIYFDSGLKSRKSTNLGIRLELINSIKFNFAV